MKTPKHIIVGMSGGVDSSVAALLLQEAGHHVEGVFMKNWEEEASTSCSASLDMADAQAVCDKLKIELHQVNFTTEYWQHVFHHFLKEYRAGRTPNPDILCNKEIKFKAFLNFALQRGADFIATGHYARNENRELLKAIDLTKDQSYFLYALNQEQLSRSLFPLGDLKKTQVREIAKNAGFINHAKKDSTGICFIGERKFKNFLNDYLPAMPGEIQTIDGKVLGTHDGLMFYTLGQRKGLKIGGLKNGIESPWYVADKNIEKNILIVTQEENALLSSSLIVNTMHWIKAMPESPSFSATAKTRYRQTDQLCNVHRLDKTQYRIEFLNPQRAVTPGQSVVLYQKENCLGGGVIHHVEK